MHAPTPTDVEQLRLVAADADAPLTTEDVAFLGSGQLMLRVDGPGRLAVIGLARTTYVPAVQVRRAIAAARTVWAMIQHASRTSDAVVDARAHTCQARAATHTPTMTLTRERRLAPSDQVVACTDPACLERLRLMVAPAFSGDVHARMVRDLIALRMQAVIAPDSSARSPYPPGPPLAPALAVGSVLDP